MLACFERCTENGWIVERWWRRIRIKVGAAAILTMYQAGLRLAAIGNLETRHIDLEAKEFNEGLRNYATRFERRE